MLNAITVIFTLEKATQTCELEISISIQSVLKVIDLSLLITAQTT